MNTIQGIDLQDNLVCNYISSLIGQFYKILPIKESGEPSLKKYMMSFQRELMGCKNLIQRFNNDELFFRLIIILQSLIDDSENINNVRCEVFKAINICKKLSEKYGLEGQVQE